jgi:nitronate monooxygenase
MAWRCPSEPVDIYVSKGGTAEETLGRMCLCNALLAAVGLGQIQHNGDPEPVVITSGDGVADVARFLPPNADSYKAADVIRYLLPDE